MPSTPVPIAQRDRQRNTSLESSPQIPSPYNSHDVSARVKDGWRKEIVPLDIVPHHWGSNLIEKLAQAVTVLSQTDEVALDDLSRFLQDQVAKHSRADLVGRLTLADCTAAHSWLLEHQGDQKPSGLRDKRRTRSTPKTKLVLPRAKRPSSRNRFEKPAVGTDDNSDIGRPYTPDQPDGQHRRDSTDFLSQKDQLPCDYTFNSPTPSTRVHSPVPSNQRTADSTRKRRRAASRSPSRARKVTRRDDAANPRSEAAESDQPTAAAVPSAIEETDAQVAARVALDLMWQCDPQRPTNTFHELDDTEPRSYISWLQDQEAHATARLASAQSHHESLAQQRSDRQATIQNLTTEREEVENQIHQADLKAQQAARDIDASSSFLRDLRTLVDSHSSVYPDELNSTLSAFRNRHRTSEANMLQAGDDVEARKDRLQEICDDLETNQTAVTALDARIEAEEKMMEEQEHAERAIVVMSRLAGLGHLSFRTMDPGVFEALEDWTKKKVAEKNEV
ncbi:hypothetical protein NW762_010956 [Fusarium torreyae]|uniref:Uncharacterized protein n=1 Tax=Fusarium torreyae TaxID=1237075 RepID=A0A9W8RSM3_9HYPO|nr:hypothetical protein NW762_010956 [Fusarium torreyae]